MVNVKKCLQFNIKDTNRQRPIKRGEPNKRGDRPSQWHFGDNTFALQNQFKATTEGWAENGWLANEYAKITGGSRYINGKPFPVSTVLNGILEE